jgi:hypothetical protein
MTGGMGVSFMLLLLLLLLPFALLFLLLTESPADNQSNHDNRIFPVILKLISLFLFSTGIESLPQGYFTWEIERR